MTRECMDCGFRSTDDIGRMCPECGGTMADKLMYEVACDSCGEVDIHESREGAEGRAEQHIRQTEHDCSIDVVNL